MNTLSDANKKLENEKTEINAKLEELMSKMKETESQSAIIASKLDKAQESLEKKKEGEEEEKTETKETKTSESKLIQEDTAMLDKLREELADQHKINNELSEKLKNASQSKIQKPTNTLK